MTLKILFVDDDDVYWELFRMALERVDVGNVTSIHRLRDGSEVIGHLQTCGPEGGWPQLMILDQRMPRMDGTEVLRALKASQPERSIPVCMMSSSDEPSLVALSYDLGAASYIVKPLDFSSLKAKIERILEFWTQVAQPPAFQVA